MLSLVFRPVPKPQRPSVTLEAVLDELATALSALIGADIHAAMTPVMNPTAGQPEPACYLRWRSHNTRHRLVLDTTWHQDGVLVIDAVLAASTQHMSIAIWELLRQAARAGCRWAAAWSEGERDVVLRDLHFDDAHSIHHRTDIAAPMGRIHYPDGTCAEWLRLSPRHMSRLLSFAWDCRIEWESLIVEDLMTQPPATYVELREDRDTVALARVLRKLFLPGIEGYDPRSKTPWVELEIESLEVLPSRKGRGFGQRLVQVVQSLQRPTSTVDTYRRAQPFWQRAGFERNPRRSAREDSNIWEWKPNLGKAQHQVCQGRLWLGPESGGVTVGGY